MVNLNYNSSLLSAVLVNVSYLRHLAVPELLLFIFFIFIFAGRAGDYTSSDEH